MAELAQMEQRLNWAMDSAVQQRWQSLDILEKRLLAQSPEVKIRNEKRALDQMTARLNVLQQNYFQLRRNALDGLEKRLLSLNPENIMKRGYAFIQHDEKIVSSVNDLAAGDLVNIRLVDGTKDAIVQ